MCFSLIIFLCTFVCHSHASASELCGNKQQLEDPVPVAPGNNDEDIYQKDNWELLRGFDTNQFVHQHNNVTNSETDNTHRRL